MSRVVILGAGVAGHTAAAFARKWLDRGDTVTVVSPKDFYNWIPSNIWVGVGLMRADQVTFPLRPVYERAGIEFVHGAARAIRPEGTTDDPTPCVLVAPTGGDSEARVRVPYDFLINATGPQLRFDRTPGLGPEANSHSVCTADHATDAARAFAESVARMKRGEKQRFIVGVGHGTCTCEGAAFEYIVNLEFELRAQGVRDRAEIVWLTNEYELGDFGMGGMQFNAGGYTTPSSMFNASLFAERGIDWITRAHPRQVEPGRVHYETVDGTIGEQAFDFAMLLPPFSGVGLTATDRQGTDITDRLFQPNGFMKVDADYAAKPYEEWRASDWPHTYQSPAYPNIFAAGIAFAPPHAISRPYTSPSGAAIAPAPPRTGMPSAIIGKTVARSIVDIIQGRTGPLHTASMAKMGAACVASAGANPFTGTAASMIVYPIVPDFERFPETGRDLSQTFGEIGLAGHWIKIILHHLFLHKARLRPGWSLIPE
ncbi:MAG: FAD-dependent oxidoreductase [Gemmatimonadales bacterium]|jgi:sulfide:quinone oxidoreductase|nr:FAD-dependent oxidoreductase [Gemmatimonadales bacterium]